MESGLKEQDESLTTGIQLVVEVLAIWAYYEGSCKGVGSIPEVLAWQDLPSAP